MARLQEGGLEIERTHCSRPLCGIREGQTMGWIPSSAGIGLSGTEDSLLSDEEEEGVRK